jgi:hypothetical protein
LTDTLVKILVGKFTQGLPDNLEKDFRDGNKGVPFSSMQELYTFAIKQGKRHRKRNQTSSEDEPASKKKKTQPSAPSQKSSDKKGKRPSKNHPPQKTYSKPSGTQGKQQRSPPSVLKDAKAAHKVRADQMAKNKQVLNTLAVEAGQPVPTNAGNPLTSCLAIVANVPAWPEPLPVFHGEHKEVDHRELNAGVMKQLVGTNRHNTALKSHQCSFCAAPLDRSMLPSQHYASCPNRPF